MSTPRNTDRVDYDGRTVRLDGKRLLNFSSSSYLGLELRPELAQGARDAMCSHGTASPFSRVHLETPLHVELEETLAETTGAPAVLVTASTVHAHLTALPSLVRSDDVVLVDRQACASLRTAAAVLRGIAVEPTRVRRLDRLEARVRELSERYERVWLVFDGLDRTFGEFAPFEALMELLAKHPKLRLYVDDSESTTWFGQCGRGAAQSHFGGHPRVVVTLGLDGAFGAAGAAMLFGDPHELDRVRIRGEALLAAPIPAPMLGAAIASAKIHQSPEFAELQSAERRRIDFMFELAEIGRIPLASVHRTPRFFLHTGTPERAVSLALSLEAQGFFVCPTRFAPGFPKSAGIGFSVSLHNDVADIERFADVLGAASQKLHKVRRPVLAAAE